jgi:hypothetical protein
MELLDEKDTRNLKKDVGSVEERHGIYDIHG